MEVISNFKVGVLIPYNVEKTIYDALNSFSNRTWDEIDLMLLMIIAVQTQQLSL